jgi:transcriptional regulator with XRE-family HTH domain
MPGFAQRIRALRLKSGRSESELADSLGVTRQAYADLERFDSEVDSVISTHQALNLARLLDTDIAALLGESAEAAPVPIAAVRAALIAQLERSPDSREALEDAIDWDIGPFLEAGAEWSTVYTLEFLRRLATLVDLDWRRLLAGLDRA